MKPTDSDPHWHILYSLHGQIINGFRIFRIIYFYKNVTHLIINQESTVAVFQGGVGIQDCIVRLHYRSGDLGGRVDREPQLGLLPVVNRQSFQ